MATSIPISNWLVLGPIFDEIHQSEHHTPEDGHPLASQIIEDIDGNTQTLDPASITTLEGGPEEGHAVIYGNDRIFRRRNYIWRKSRFHNIDWNQAGEIEDNIHRHLHSDAGVVGPTDPLSFSGKHHALVFFLAYIKAPSTRSTTLCIRSDDSVRVWLNGAEVEELAYAGERDITQALAETCADIRLRKGVNVLLTAVAETHVEWGFSARIENDEDLQINPSNPLFETSCVPGRARSTRLRIFTSTASGTAAVGVPILVVAELAEAGGHARFANVAFIESDRVGYASISVESIVNLQSLRHVWLRPFDNPRLAIDACPVLEAGIEPAVLHLEVPNDSVPNAHLDPRLPSIPDPDIIDWKLSPQSFSTKDPLPLLDSGCEEFPISNEAEHRFHFVQLIRDDQKIKPLEQAAVSTECETTYNEFGPPDIPQLCYRQGAMLEYEILWIPVGHALGKVVYSLPLAPCESVNLAVIDWQRKDDTARLEDTSAAEQLIHNQRRDRQIEETVTASITEVQEGGSFMGGLGGAASGTWGAFTFGGTHAIGGTTAHTSGERNIAAEGVQKVLDTIQQTSSKARRLHSSIVVQASQAEQEKLQTRTVTNHNHCHALTVLYYEVLRHYRIAVRFVRKQDVLFIKNAPINRLNPSLTEQFQTGETFSTRRVGAFNEELAYRFRIPLTAALLDQSLRPCFDALDAYVCAITSVSGLYQNVPWRHWQLDELEIGFITGDISNVSQQRPVKVFLITDTGQKLRLKRLDDLRYDVTSGDFAGSTGVPVDEYLLAGYLPVSSAEDEKVYAFSPGREDLFTVRPDQRVRWERIAQIEIESHANWELVHFFARTSHNETSWLMYDEDVSVTLDGSPEAPATRVIPVKSLGPRDELDESQRCCIDKLVRHLNENLHYYSKAIWLNQDADERASLLEKYKWSVVLENTEEGRLPDFLENRIVGITGDFVALPLTYSKFADTIEHETPVNNERIVSLPTRGVFAEAKLSHCNSCEERDVTRYWDWSESPCPRPPEITGISPGSRAQQTELAPTVPEGELEVEAAPEAPNPGAMLNSVLEVLGQEGIFENLSGQTELAGLLGQLVEGAVELTKAQIQGRALQAAQQPRRSEEAEGAARTEPTRRAEPSEAQEAHERQRVIETAQQRGQIDDNEARRQHRANLDRMNRGGETGESEASGLEIRPPLRLLEADRAVPNHFREVVSGRYVRWSPIAIIYDHLGRRIDSKPFDDNNRAYLNIEAGDHGMLEIYATIFYVTGSTEDIPLSLEAGHGGISASVEGEIPLSIRVIENHSLKWWYRTDASGSLYVWGRGDDGEPHHDLQRPSGGRAEVVIDASRFIPTSTSPVKTNSASVEFLMRHRESEETLRQREFTVEISVAPAGGFAPPDLEF